jgi:hypothetical protein
VGYLNNLKLIQRKNENLSVTHFLVVNKTTPHVALVYLNGQLDQDFPWCGNRIPVGRYLHNPQQIQTTNIHALGGIRTGYPNNHAAADMRLRLHGRWDQHEYH